MRQQQSSLMKSGRSASTQTLSVMLVGETCEVKELAGGCICCTANVPFRQAVVSLLRQQPDHLIIEPTGIAAVGSVRDVFSEPGIQPVVELDPVVVVMDREQWANPRIQAHELYQERQAAEVMVMVMSMCAMSGYLLILRLVILQYPYSGPITG